MKKFEYIKRQGMNIDGLLADINNLAAQGYRLHTLTHTSYEPPKDKPRMIGDGTHWTAIMEREIQGP